MKLLFDENLPPRLAESFAAEFPGSVHVRSVGLARAEDVVIWHYAKDHDFVIVSRDDDFRQRSFRFGPPPKVVWLRLGECSTQRIETTLRRSMADLETFGQDSESGLLVLG